MLNTFLVNFFWFWCLVLYVFAFHFILLVYERESMNSETAVDGIFNALQEPSRSIINIRKTGEILGIESAKIENLIAPQDLHVYRLHPNIGGFPLSVWGCTAFHNRARGIYKGGIRISEDVNTGETMELARLMTLKTALVELELGGAKTGIQFDMAQAYRMMHKDEYDPEFERGVKRAIMREYAHHYRGMLSKTRYVPAPDVGTGPSEMVVIYDETKNPASVTGKPEGVPGWLPGRTEATGYGVYYVTKSCLKREGKSLEGVKVAIHGFGNVGSNAAKFLIAEGAVIIAVADKDGVVIEKEGIDVVAICEYVKKHGTVKGFCNSQAALLDFFAVECDVMIPAAINDSISENKAAVIKARYVIEGANFPTTYAALNMLTERGITVVPDIIANAGGVIASCEEYTHPTATSKLTHHDVYRTIESSIGKNLDEAWNVAEEKGLTLDMACTLIAVDRVYRTMKNHGWV